MRKVRIVIPVLNNLLLTLMCLSSLRQQDEALDIVVVDNGSDDDTLAALRGNKDIRLIVNPDRYTYARSINMGAALKGDWDVLIVVNNDTVFAPGSVSELIHALDDFCSVALPLSPKCASAAGVTPPRLRRPESMDDVYQTIEDVERWWSSHEGSFKENKLITAPYVPQGGYCFAIAHEMWDQLGGMDEEYELFGEDYDLFDRALRFTKIAHARRAYVEHLEHQTVSWIGDERDARMCRSRFLLTEKREGIKEMVSVVIPTYNRTDALFEAIDSVLKQTMPHWRLYVIDDGSQDWDRIQRAATTRYRGHENRIWFIHLPHNQGPGGARNKGVEISSGKYIAFLDSDDVWKSNHLEEHLRHHETTPSCLMSYSETDFAWRWWDEEFRRYRYMPDQHPEEQLKDWRYWPERLEQECFIKTSSTVFWAGLFKEKGLLFNVDPHNHEPGGAVEDWDLFREVMSIDPLGINHIPKVTARTHWAKNLQEEGHHSSRLIPWANYTTVLDGWKARLDVPVEQSDCPVTVVIPTRDRSQPLSACIKSLGDHAPVVIVSDGRESRPYAMQIAQSRPYTGLVSLSEPLGPSVARNRGIEAVRSEWTWFLDDDDLALPGWLDLVSPYLDDYDAIVCDLIASADGALTIAGGVYTSGILVRTELFKKCGGFDEGSRWAEEREALSRFESFGARTIRTGRAIAVKTASQLRTSSISLPGQSIHKVDPR
jgi:glycosyltransferase involved in cell wall biosynthesis